MNIINVSNVKKTFTSDIIFENLKFEVNAQDRIGLVGRNGEGKTTLLNLLAGMEKQDEGHISWRKNLSVGMLIQQPEFPDDQCVMEILMEAFEELNEINDEMEVLENKMAEVPAHLEKIIEKYGRLQETYEELGGYSRHNQVKKVATGLKIDDLLEKSWHVLSGGERTKTGLARLLLTSPDLLLLDEPTNHLDISSIEWLTSFIKGYDGSVVIVSHDRYFLDDTVNKIFEIEQNMLHIYHGDYSYFVKEKEARILREFQEFQDQQKKMQKMKKTIKQLKLWANQASPPNAGLHRRAKSMEKALERIERVKKPVVNPSTMRVTLSRNEKVSNDIFVLKNIAKMYDDILFENLNLLVRRDEHIAIVGDNGTGKSTLVRMLLGGTEADEGEISVAPNISIGYLSQHTFSEVSKKTVLEVFREEVSVTEGQTRHILAQFLFYGEDVFKTIGNLSGGEKMRLRWAQIVNQEHNVLILDEPTNHLDIDSKETLEDALEKYDGTIIAVSHDRHFLDKHFNVTYWVENRQLTRFEGNYTYARRKKQE